MGQPNLHLFFCAINPAFKPFLGLSFFIEKEHQKAKTEKHVVKTIKYIYSEPRILIL